MCQARQQRNITQEIQTEIIYSLDNYIAMKTKQQKIRLIPQPWKIPARHRTKDNNSRGTVNSTVNNNK